MMNDVGIIHMGGRIYDPVLGRFLQADPIIQAPKNSQSFNRYSYVFNNPLSYTDPSGFSAWTKFRDKWLKPIISIAAIYVFGPVIGGMLSGYISTGSLKGALIGAFTGALGATFGGLDGITGFLVNGAVGGLANKAMGGKFGHGFLSAGIGNAIGGSIKALKTATGRVIASAIVGGTISKITGGKFANGAFSAAFASSLAEMGGSSTVETADPNDAKYAELANAVYSEDLAKGTVVGDYKVDAIHSNETGMKAALFVGNDGSRVLALAGTSPTSFANWKANLLQAFGFNSAQYTEGLSIASNYHDEFGSNLHFTGHSLGGGIATAAAITTGGSATVFNAAGVHNNTIKGYSRNSASVKYYYSATDALRMGNMLTPSSVPGAGVNLGFAGAHGMGGICNAMGARC
jgi:RHS repeat-associated protein